MKILLAFIILIGLQRDLFAQNIVVSADRMNVAYVGIPNPLTVAVENCKPDQVIVTAYNGTLTNNGNGNYDYTPEKTGKGILTISIKIKNGTKEIGRSVYRIRQIPKPVVHISPTQEAKKEHPSWDWQPGLVAIAADTALKAPFTILSFEVFLIRNKQVDMIAKNQGARFEGLAKVILSKLMPDDRIVFSNILCKYPNGDIAKLDDLVINANGMPADE